MYCELRKIVESIDELEYELQKSVPDKCKKKGKEKKDAEKGKKK